MQTKVHVQRSLKWYSDQRNRNRCDKSSHQTLTRRVHGVKQSNAQTQLCYNRANNDNYNNVTGRDGGCNKVARESQREREMNSELELGDDMRVSGDETDMSDDRGLGSLRLLLPL